MISSIFLNDVSVIDHAFIDSRGLITGGSFLCSFIISGHITEDESVVVDFSTIKKDIKRLIDGHRETNYTNGFDHKLWILEGYSHCEWTLCEGEYVITTPHSKFILPLDAVKIFKADDYNSRDIALAIQEFLENNLRDFKIACTLSEKPIFTKLSGDYITHMFRYVHGLKDSSSYGCQSIAHGHLSFLSVHNSNDLDALDEMTDVIFINSENIINDNKEFIEIEYTTDRGRFYSKYDKKFYNIFVLNTETTVEYLAEFAKQYFNIKNSFLISEGLNKGTYVN